MELPFVISHFSDMVLFKLAFCSLEVVFVVYAHIAFNEHVCHSEAGACKIHRWLDLGCGLR